MNILFIRDPFPFGRTYQRKRALEELGHSVTAHSSPPEGFLREETLPIVPSALESGILT
jgi:hypothetical protein